MSMDAALKHLWRTTQPYFAGAGVTTSTLLSYGDSCATVTVALFYIVCLASTRLLMRCKSAK